jgi:FKBP-type peptidyl-prolyl cis-trans isomerase SlyD
MKDSSDKPPKGGSGAAADLVMRRLCRRPCRSPAAATLCDHPAMQIQRPCVVTLTWRLEDTEGDLLDELDEPTEFIVGGQDLLAKVEDALLGQEAGFSAHLHLEPEYAFGEYDAKLVCFEARELFGETVEPGMILESLPEGAKTAGMPQDVFYTVSEVFPSHVVLDGNHPLAGLALRLQLKVHAVRPAEGDEVEAGRVGASLLSVLSAPTRGDLLH